MSSTVVKEWTSSGRTFKLGDRVTMIWSQSSDEILYKSGVVTEIRVCSMGDGHVIINNWGSSLTDFRYVDFDKSYYRNIKLEELGI